MSENARLPKTQWYDLAEIDAALEIAYKNLMLEHARLGRSIPECQGGKVIEVTPTEIFARFGLDENGKPVPETRPADQPHVKGSLAR